jgi:DNA-binding NarL/FixJ family response regulator
MLTRRESEVLVLASRGHSNTTIAETLGQQVNTVKSYMKATMQKLRAGSRERVGTRTHELEGVGLGVVITDLDALGTCDRHAVLTGL